MKRFVLSFLFLFSMCLGLAAPTLEAAAPPAYYINEAKLPFTALTGTTTTRYWGVLAGAAYRIEVPQNWNGELVLYAHGYRGNPLEDPQFLELTVDNPPIRKYLVEHGFAWAASSYSKNGYDVKEGAKDTHLLGQYFNSLMGNPNRTYIVGVSMGGHITGVMTEQYGNTYAGAMPVCGVMGDIRLFDFFLDFNVVAAALAGVQAQFPYPANYQTAIVPQVKSALGTVLPGFPFIILNSKGQELEAVTAQRSGGTRPLFDFAFHYWFNFLFSLGRGNGTLDVAPGNVASNVDTVYQADSNPALTPAELALNQSVLRVASTPQGRQPNGLANIPPVNGDIHIPVLTMHTIGDLFVPFSMEQIYNRRVAQNGAADLLVQRAIRAVEHCGFTIQELEEGFRDLVNWTENGVKPAGDDITNPLVVADPYFGCQFTRTRRLYDPTTC